MTAPNEKLRACPFCGHTNVELANTWTPSFWVECEDCCAQVHGVAMPQKDDDCCHYSADPQAEHERKYADLPEHYREAADDAIWAWNRRTPPAGDGGCPTAWMRLHITPGSPDGPAERDYDFVYGDVEPEGDGWVPLYTHPAPAQAVGISEAQIQALEWCVKIATETPYPKDAGVTRETFRTARACLASLRAAPSEDAIPDVLEHIVGRAEREAVPGSALDSMCKEVRAWLRGEGV